MVFIITLIAGIIYIFKYLPPLSKKHGIVDTKLYLGKSNNQALRVAFGGGGGKDWFYFIMSGKQDDQWPAEIISNKLMKRLQENNFKFYHHHTILDGGHIEPLHQFRLAYDFLEQYVPVE